MSLKLIKIGDLGEVITGNTPPKKDPENYGGDYPFIKPTDMDIDKKYVTEWDETYSEKAYNKYHRAYIPPGATGVVTIGTVGEKLFQAHQHCFTNQSVNVIIPNDNYYDDYVFYLMKLNLPKVENANPGTASGRHHVSKSNFCSIKVDVVECLNSQKRIADILSAYDDLIENNLKRIKLLEQAAQNIYKEWFVNLRFPGHENTPINEKTGLPEGWCKINLYDFAEIQMGYAFKAKDFNDEMAGNPAIRIRDILDGWTKTYTTETVNEKYYVEHGDILVGMDGIFHMGIWSGQEKALLVQRVCRLRANNKNLQGYLLESLRAPIKYYEQTISGATVAHLGAKHLKEIFILIPDEKLLNKLSLFNTFDSQIITLNKQNQKLKAARDILLPRLMNRTIEV